MTTSEMAWSQTISGFQRKQTPCGMKSDAKRRLTKSIMAGVPFSDRRSFSDAAQGSAAGCGSVDAWAQRRGCQSDAPEILRHARALQLRWCRQFQCDPMTGMAEGRDRKRRTGLR